MSITIQAALAVIIIELARILNLELSITQGRLEEIILSVIAVVAAGIAWYGRYRKGDVTLSGKRIKPTVTIESLP